MGNGNFRKQNLGFTKQQSYHVSMGNLKLCNFVKIEVKSKIEADKFQCMKVIMCPFVLQPR